MNPRLVVIIAVGIVLIVLAGLGVVYFGDLLSTRALGPKGGRVSLRQGQMTAVEITTTKAPSVKIELCQEGTKPEKCQTLAAKTTGKQATVKIPVKFPLGKAIIKVVERNAAGKITPTVQYRRAVLVVKGAPTPAPAAEQGGGGGGGSDSSDNGGGSNGGSAPASVNYELTGLFYEGADKSIHLRWKPVGAILYYRTVGETTWHYPAEEYNLNSNPYSDSDDRRTIIYIHSPGLPPNTDFEFYFEPGAGAPAGLPATSQIYQYNSGPQPNYGEFRSLL